MTLLFCTSGLSAPRTLSTPPIVFGKTRYITHLRLFFSPPVSRFLAAPDVTGEAQTVWPSHRDLHRDTQRRVGVFVFYSQCKKSRAYQRGGGEKVGRINLHGRQLAGVKTRWQFYRLLDCSVSIIGCALSGSRRFFSQIPPTPPNFLLLPLAAATVKFVAQG